jgi:predicted PurR-regulated permease PerM
MKFNKSWLEKKWVAYSVATCSAVVLYLVLSHINLLFTGIHAVYSFISPVFAGLIIAYILNPVVKFFQKTLFHKVGSKKLGRNLSVMVTSLIVVVLIAILMVELIPQFVNSIIGLFSNLGGYATSLQNFLKTLNQTAASKDMDISGITSFGDKLLNMLTSSIPNNMNNIINTSFSIGKGFINGFIASVMAIYFLLDKERLQHNFKKLLQVVLPERRYREIGDFWGRCNSILLQYIGCDFLDGLIVGVANFTFMVIAGIPYSLLISIFIGVTNLAPTFGPILGGTIGTAILLLVNPWYALWFLMFILVMHTIDGYIIKPKLFGNTMGVSPVWILITIIVGGRMFGIWGIMLAIPFAAIFDYVYKDLIWKKLEKHNQTAHQTPNANRFLEGNEGEGNADQTD